MNGASEVARTLRKLKIDLFLVVVAGGAVGDDVEAAAEGVFVVLVDERVEAAVERLALEVALEVEDLVVRVVGVAEDDECAVDRRFHDGSCGDEDMLNRASDCFEDLS